MADPIEKRETESTAFWRERVFRTIARGGMLHQIIFDDSYDLWQYAQGETAGIIKRYITGHQKVLDAGCGYGALNCCLQEAQLDVDYTGIDISPDLIELARYRYPESDKRRFYVGDLKDLFRSTKERYVYGYFDWAVVRSVEGMIKHDYGDGRWAEMLKEIKRVSKHVILISYPETVGGEVVYEVAQ